MNRLPPVQYVAKNMRLDLRLMSEMIAPGSRVLDIGSGDGSLIEHLFRTRGCDARGIELDMAAVTHAVAHGLPVMHGDADTDLEHYPDGAFDYVVLSRTLQAVERPREVLRQMLRIGTRALVSFPNFGHWLVRWQLLAGGRMPMTGDLGPPLARDAEHPPLHHPRLLRPVPAGGLQHRALAGSGRGRPQGALAAVPMAGQPVRGAGVVPDAQDRLGPAGPSHHTLGGRAMTNHQHRCRAVH